MPRIPYKLKDGTRVPGTTTIIGQLMDYGKQDSLMDWGQGLAVNYEEEHKPIYWKDARNTRGKIGTMAHGFIIGTIARVEYTDLPPNSTKEEIKEACEISNVFTDWYDPNANDILYTEKNMVSETHKFGGTPDIITQTTLDDIKTGYVSTRNFYELCLQLAAYDALNIENHNHTVDVGRILKVDTTGVRVYEFTREQLDLCFLDFLSLLRIYNGQKLFNKEVKNESARNSK